MQTKVALIAHVRVDREEGQRLSNEAAVNAAKQAVRFRIADAYVETEFSEDVKIVAVIPADDPVWPE